MLGKLVALQSRTLPGAEVPPRLASLAQGPTSLSRVAFAHQHCHQQHLLWQLKVVFEAEGTVFMWFRSRKKVVNGLSGKDVWSPREAFRNTPVATWEGFAVTTSFSIRVQKSIAFLRDRVLHVTAKTKAHTREASQNIQQIQHVRAST